jgi:hypothetical protein
MMLFAGRVEHPLDVAVRGSHDTDAPNIVGPPGVATRIKASIAACHSEAV